MRASNLEWVGGWAAVGRGTPSPERRPGMHIRSRSPAASQESEATAEAFSICQPSVVFCAEQGGIGGRRQEGPPVSKTLRDGLRGHGKVLTGCSALGLVIRSTHLRLLHTLFLRRSRASTSSDIPTNSSQENMATAVLERDALHWPVRRCCWSTWTSMDKCSIPTMATVARLKAAIGV